MKPRRILAALLPAVLMGCGADLQAGASQPQTLTVFAASSLTDAFTEIEAAFEAANPGVEVVFSFSGSQMLRRQIDAGASADVFASANMEEMDALVGAGLVSPDAPRVFLTNQLAVILPASNPAGLHDLPDLARPGLKLVLAAEDVPIGSYTRRVLEMMNRPFGADFNRRVLANVVSNEDNVKQVVAKVLLGEADAGIVYSSDADAAAGLRTIEIPPDLNVIAEYPIAVLASSTHAALAQRFVEWVLSPAGQAVLQAWGFGPVG
ncbi:MAG: molybdate ABC transporter substrate-binding protein [Chloroflexota bacterium]